MRHTLHPTEASSETAPPRKCQDSIITALHRRTKSTPTHLGIDHRTSPTIRNATPEKPASQSEHPRVNYARINIDFRPFALSPHHSPLLEGARWNSPVEPLAQGYTSYLTYVEGWGTSAKHVAGKVRKRYGRADRVQVEVLSPSVVLCCGCIICYSTGGGSPASLTYTVRVLW